MTSWKMHLGAAAFVLLAGHFGSGAVRAAPAIGAGSIADAVKTTAPAVEDVRYRRRGYGHRRYSGYGYRRYGGYYGRRHWRRRHDGFPAALLLGGLLGAGLGYGG